MRDIVFREEHPEIAEFAFDEKVAAVFADMLKRSVPGYGTIISLIAVLAKKYAQPNTAIYDLGCSLGAVSLTIAQNVKNCRIFGFDISSPMIEKAKVLVLESKKERQVSLFCEDITEINFEKSSFVVLNLTLQFINPDERASLLKKIYNSLVENGVLILTEKINNEDDFFTDVYYDFKRANGYNETEISQKRAALENVLIADSEKIHIKRLSDVGFKKTQRWFQAINFCSYIAWK
ncbi:MAG: carboxy-S-adenosyl-L-methionine synthase CmoA [Chitinispirillales bacterium]|jgi:tRNA (cmo5U34)-methyltransferase|nr:carboxy-S-adenosyl-L-methionine synthase CmoA [Chitinispirillales bacterium]